MNSEQDVAAGDCGDIAMSPAELRCVMEWLGLSTGSLAQVLCDDELARLPARLTRDGRLPPPSLAISAAIVGREGARCDPGAHGSDGQPETGCDSLDGHPPPLSGAPHEVGRLAWPKKAGPILIWLRKRRISPHRPRNHKTSIADA